MGDYTKLEKLKMEHEQNKIYRENIKLTGDACKSIKCFTTLSMAEGLWFLMGVDLFFILGECPVVAKPGIDEEEEIRIILKFEQRKALIEMLDGLQEMSKVNIPIPVIGDKLEKFNPLQVPYLMVKGFHKVIKRTTPKGAYVAIPLEYRILIATTIPLAFRTAYKLMEKILTAPREDGGIPFIPGI